MQPLRPRLEELGIGAIDREAEVISAVGTHDAFAHYRVPGVQALHVAADLGHLSGPLVTRNDRIAHRDDVLAIQEFKVGVADPDSARSDEHLLWPDLGRLAVRDDRALWRLKDQRLHFVLLSRPTRLKRTT